MEKDSKETQVEEVKTTDEKTFTQAELDAIVKQRLERANKKAEEQKAETERLAKLSAEEKLNEELKKFEQERKKHQKEKLEYEATKQLADLGLSTEFGRFFIGSDLESTKRNIDFLNSIWQTGIQAEVDKRIKSANNPPHAGNISPNIGKLSDSSELNQILSNKLSKYKK